MSLTKADLHHLLDALQAAEEELEQLMYDKEWFVTDVVDQLASAKEIVVSHLKEVV